MFVSLTTLLSVCFVGLGLFFTELATEGVLSELVCVDDFVLMIETLDDIRNKFRKLQETFESRGL